MNLKRSPFAIQDKNSRPFKLLSLAKLATNRSKVAAPIAKNIINLALRKYI